MLESYTYKEEMWSFNHVKVELFVSVDSKIWFSFIGQNFYEKKWP